MSIVERNGGYYCDSCNEPAKKYEGMGIKAVEYYCECFIEKPVAYSYYYTDWVNI